MYMRSELFKVIKSKKSIFFITLMLLIPFIDLISNMLTVYKDYWMHKDAYGGVLSSSMVLHPAMGSFLAGGSQGHIAQMLLIWILPIYLMIIYSDSYIREVQYGYNNIIFSKSNRVTLIKEKFRLSFRIPFFISFISLTINFILAQIIFFGGTDFKGMIIGSGFEGVCLSHPNIAYLLYIIVYSVISGGCGVLCSGISYLIPYDKIAYPVVFFIWIVQIISPYSLTYAIQPFIEYGPEYFVPALVTFIIIVIGIAAISYRYKVKYDEI